MSKKSISQFPPSKLNDEGDLDDDDDDEDDVVISPKLTKNYKKPEQKPLRGAGGLNDSFGRGEGGGGGRSLGNSHERDSFLNAFLDRDANMKHGMCSYNNNFVNSSFQMIVLNSKAKILIQPLIKASSLLIKLIYV